MINLEPMAKAEFLFGDKTVKVDVYYAYLTIIEIHQEVIGVYGKTRPKSIREVSKWLQEEYDVQCNVAQATMFNNAVIDVGRTIQAEIKKKRETNRDSLTSTEWTPRNGSPGDEEVGSTTSIDSTPSESSSEESSDDTDSTASIKSS